MPEFDAQRLHDIDRVEPGTRLGERFELIELAGTGGMSEVFRARDGITGALVAVKVLGERHPNYEARFAREAQMLAELQHPAIVRYIAHGFTGAERPYLVMEWLEGEDLARRLLGGPLSLAETLALGARVADALRAAHARGIVHRDVKPANIFLVGGDVEQTKVLDFGIARLLGQAALTRTGTFFGTPGYMAPEQARSGGEIGPPADVFALGCVLLECLAGRPAFSGELLAMLAKILFEEPPRLGELVPEVPAELEELVASMLRKDPAARPRDGAALVAALAAIEAPPTPRVAPIGAAQREALTAGERRVVSVVLVGRVDAGPTHLAPTLRLDEAEDEHERLGTTAEAHKGRLVMLADGSSLITIRGSAVATDQAAYAARCALAVRALLPAERPIVLATGRSPQSRLLVGETVERAARLLASLAASSAARAHGGVPPIPIDDVTAGLLDARFDVGEAEAGEGLVLRGEHALAEGVRTLLGRPTTCVGRDRELRAVEAIVDESIEQSTSAAVLITGAAGIGKSRLLQELLRQIRARHPEIAIWIGRGDPLRAGSAFGLIGQAIHAAAGIRGGEPLEERWQLLRARVARHVPAEQERVAELLGELASAPFPDEASPQLRAARADATQLAEQVRWAFQDFLAAECAAHPVLLVLEDLHWGDLPTVRLVDTVMRERCDLPFLVIALARPEVHALFPRLWAERNLQMIGLNELNRKASERLVRQVLGPDVSAATVERLVERSGGHAFYLEELIRTCAEHSPGASLPETVLAMIEARLGSLESEARRVLRAASVFGEVFWKGGVAALLGGVMQPTPAGDWLAVLVEREVLTWRRDSHFLGETELTFRHSLLREGAYAMLTEEDRVLGHRLAAGWLEHAGETDPMVLAEHFERGNMPARAAEFLLRAAYLAFHLDDVDAMMRRTHRGLELVRALPEEEQLQLHALKVGLLGIRTDVHNRRSEWQEGLACAEEVQRLAPPGSASWSLAAVLNATTLVVPEQEEKARKNLDLLCATEPLPGALSDFALALFVACLCLSMLGRIDACEVVLRRFSALVDPVAAQEPQARAWLELALGLRESWVHEDPWSGLQWSRTSVTSFASFGQRAGGAVARLFVGMNLWFLGAPEEAERALRASMEAAPDAIMGEFVSLRTLVSAGVMSELGELEEAQKVVERALAPRGRGFPYADGHAHWALARVLLRRGDLEAAEREAVLGIEKLQMVPHNQAAATATLASIQLARGRAPAALATAREAMRRSEAHRAFGFKGSFTRLVHVEALLAGGHAAEARAALAEARNRLLAQATQIGDAELHRSFLEVVPENVRLLALAAEQLDR